MLTEKEFLITMRKLRLFFKITFLCYFIQVYSSGISILTQEGILELPC